ncbi:heme acquisition protein HasA [Pseudomonas flavescens]|uniref:Heme acquisition protein HasA n=1 Tax=Phytopseudomonas flavescens TaxID=29435 RepID=A0A1G8AJL8_9GAMM|nr:heme acquisition protein HasA [Pseudomonas flavescens]SDH21087.1 heme acquisition protein HasA [Pseudomonas flavescens]
MAISYSYEAENFPVGFTSGGTLEDLLLVYQQDGVAGEHPANTGGFYTNGVASGLSGDTYAMSLNDGNFSFSAVGSLTYNFSSHALYGTLQQVTLGGGLNADGTVSTPLITFDFGTTPLTATAAEGRDNAVHDVIWGLMNGSVEGATDSAGTPNDGGLLAVLDAAGLSDDIITTTGSSSFSESELLLAA